MFGNILRYSALIVLVLGIPQGSSLSVGELTSQHSAETIRQVKSAEMFKYMNLSADPCENFYEYTCGNFGRYNPVDPDNRPAIGLGEILNEALEARLNDELDNDYPSDTAADKNVKKFYRSCMHIPQTLDYEYPENLKSILSEFGEMPAVEGYWWREDDFDWVKTLSEMLHKSGNPLIFDISVNPDLSDNSVTRVYMTQPTAVPLGSRDVYLDEAFASTREKYAEIIKNVLQNYLGVEDETSALEKAWDIVNFEIGLAHGMFDAKSGAALTDALALTNIEELQRKYLDVGDLKRLVNDAMGATITEVNVQTDYVENAMQLLQQTPKEVVANYIFFSYLFNFVYIPQDSAEDLQKYCRKKLKVQFHKNVDNLLFRKYFAGDGEEILFGIWRELKKSLRDAFYSPRLNWIRQDTRDQAIEKLKYMKLQVLSYPEPEVSETVGQLDIDEYDYVHNIDAILTARGRKAIAKLHQPPQSPDLGVSVSTTAAYNTMQNVVMIPFSFLQPYYTWSSAYPDAFNFGYLGFFIAHEITHGFDDSGRLYDAKGNARGWWDTRTEQVFRERTQCFVDQYKELIYEGHHLPEMKLQAENIADGGGIHVAYEAYLNWYRKAAASGQRNDLKTFPDFRNHSHEQMFFISYAHAWCSNYDPTKVALQLIDTHTPNPLRAIGPLANSEEFAKVFNCPRGTPMNPVNKCIIY